jgi:hypothetical protein
MRYEGFDCSTKAQGTNAPVFPYQSFGITPYHMFLQKATVTIISIPYISVLIYLLQHYLATQQTHLI